MKSWKDMKIIPKNDQSGFALLEAMLAVVTFAITMSAMFLMLSGSFKAGDSARGITEESAFAANQIEDIYPLDYQTDPSLADGTHPSIVIDDKYTVSYQIDQDTYLRNTKLITVTVQWNQKGMNKTVVINHIKPDTI